MTPVELSQDKGKTITTSTCRQDGGGVVQEAVNAKLKAAGVK
jgi:hypothetical protein